MCAIFCDTAKMMMNWLGGILHKSKWCRYVLHIWPYSRSVRVFVCVRFLSKKTNKIVIFLVFTRGDTQFFSCCFMLERPISNGIKKALKRTVCPIRCHHKSPSSMLLLLLLFPNGKEFQWKSPHSCFNSNHDVRCAISKFAWKSNTNQHQHH